MIPQTNHWHSLGRWARRLLPIAIPAVCALSGAASTGTAAGGNTDITGGGKAPAANLQDAINPGTPWPATDALGRNVPVAGEAPNTRPNRFVGIFYFLTLGYPMNGPYDVSKVLARDPDAVNKPELWKQNEAYFWGEPLFGYYNTQDPWVLRRHANLLADAGVDTLIFDTTNRVTFPEVYLKLCEVFDQVRKEGGRTPQICFMTNTKAGETAEELYNTLYKPGLYRDLWFQWQGRPLLICDPNDASPTITAFFTLRKAHWPFQLVNTPYAWHWESAYPQVYGYTDDPTKPEMVNVAVAQNLRAADAQVTDMSRGDARGRSFHDGFEDTSPGAINWGYNFAEQWRRAYELDPPFVMVTGWNEWTAGCYRRDDKSVVFVDQFNEEFSRDTEPMKGGHGDNYYLQLVAGIRRYKGVPALPRASAAKTIKLENGFAQWEDVRPEFTDHIGDTDHRDFRGAGDLRYVNTSGRNDLVMTKVARDGKQVAFYARTAQQLSPRTDPAWMWLLIDADQNPKTGWEGFDFIVNRIVEPDGSTWLEKHDGGGGWRWTKILPVAITTQANELMLVIPRSALGLPTGKTALALDFKWVDNMEQPGDPLDFYLSGDTAPDGRFKYRYVAR